MTVLIDTREKHPWQFPEDKEFAGAISQKLDTGDYSIQGYEDIFCIERKESISELVNNMFEKRFREVLKRIEAFKYKVIILEFGMEEINKFPAGTGMPRANFLKMKNVKTNHILGFISSMSINYGIHVFLANDKVNANYLANRIMKRVYERENNKR